MALRHAVLTGAAVLVLAACGSQEKREPVVAATPAAPADLCALVPDSAKTGLEAASTSDTGGDPTAACSLRSAPGRKPAVRVVITWTQLDDGDSATDVLDSQCRAIDTTEYEVVQGYTATGADKACGAKGKASDEASIAATSGDAVLTVRLSSVPAGTAPALTRGTQMLESVISQLSRKS